MRIAWFCSHQVIMHSVMLTHSMHTRCRQAWPLGFTSHICLVTIAVVVLVLMLGVQEVRVLWWHSHLMREAT